MSMAQRIVTLCDAHQQHDEDMPGATWEVSLLAPGESKPTTWEVDLCDDDGKTLRDLAVMLGAVGRRTAGPRKGPKGRDEYAARLASSGTTPAKTAPRDRATTACPVEGCDYVGPSRMALNSHVPRAHDMSLAQAEGTPEPYACPDCNFRSSRAQGLGAHRRAVHGVVGAGVSSGG